MSQFNRILLVISLAFFSCLTVGCQSSTPKTAVSDVPVEKTEQLLGTVITVKAYGDNATAAVEEAFNRVTEIENHMSPSIVESDVSKINQMAGVKPVKVNADTFFVIEKALAYAKLSNGAFDPAIGNIIKLWGIGTDHAKIPTDAELAPYIKQSLYHHIVLNKDTSEIYLDDAKAQIDLGAIAKGYSGDEMKRILTEHGITSALLNLGGNVLSMGTKPNDKDWVVGLQDPLASDRGTYIGKMVAPNKTIVTSGNYERYFVKDNVRYHHIIDANTGFPSNNGVISATIITDTSIDADALSTSVYILGKDKGLALVESLDNVEAIFITQDKQIFASSGITDELFTLTSKEYTYEKR
ncbi:MAG: FAD:protein FMN transferase [Cellulosilyticaceae bacterium]